LKIGGKNVVCVGESGRWEKEEERKSMIVRR